MNLSSLRSSEVEFSGTQNSLVDPLYDDISLVDPLYSEEVKADESIQSLFEAIKNRYSNAKPLHSHTHFHLVRNPPENEKDCGICTDPITEEDAIRGNSSAHRTETFAQGEFNQNQHTHYFHSSCIDEWRSAKRNDFHCPTCRTSALNKSSLDLRPKEWKDQDPILKKIQRNLPEISPSAHFLISSLCTTALAKGIEYTFSTSPWTAHAGATLIRAAASGKIKQIAKGFIKGLVIGNLESVLGLAIVPFLIHRHEASASAMLFQDELNPFQFAVFEAFTDIPKNDGAGIALASISGAINRTPYFYWLQLFSRASTLSRIRDHRGRQEKNLAPIAALATGLSALSFTRDYVQAATQAAIVYAGVKLAPRLTTRLRDL